MESDRMKKKQSKKSKKSKMRSLHGANSFYYCRKFNKKLSKKINIRSSVQKIKSTVTFCLLLQPVSQFLLIYRTFLGTIGANGTNWDQVSYLATICDKVLSPLHFFARILKYLHLSCQSVHIASRLTNLHWPDCSWNCSLFLVESSQGVSSS